MRVLLTIFCFIFVEQFAFSQESLLKSDTFDLREYQSHYRLVLRSDKTFYMRTKHHTSNKFDFGFYKISGDTVELSIYNKITIKTKEELSFPSNKEEVVTFLIRDCFGNAVDNFEIIFIDKMPYDTSVLSDKEGKIIVEKAKFKRYFTEADEENETYQTDPNVGQLLSSNAKTVIVTLCVPKSNRTEGKDFYKLKLRMKRSPS